MTRQPLSAAERKAIFERDEYTCQVCGKVGNSKGLEIHHIMPVIHGGTNEPANLVTLCPSCHVQRDICAGARQGSSSESRVSTPIVFDLPRMAQDHLRELAQIYGADELTTLQLIIDRAYCQEHPYLLGYP